MKKFNTDKKPIWAEDVTSFFTWTAWAASANRPNAPFSYTVNWPHNDLVGNEAPGQFLVWSIVSVVVLIAVKSLRHYAPLSLTTILYLGSGVIGTLHHLYFAGTPSFIAAMGAVASALEVVPLTLIGFEVVKTLRLSQQAEGFYRWPLRFFLATCFWNLVGAGVFGFLINPPLVLYYSQGLNTTPIHAHSALFGVYGCLAIAMLLFTVPAIYAVFQ